VCVKCTENWIANSQRIVSSIWSCILCIQLLRRVLTPHRKKWGAFVSQKNTVSRSTKPSGLSKHWTNEPKPQNFGFYSQLMLRSGTPSLNPATQQTEMCTENRCRNTTNSNSTTISKYFDKLVFFKTNKRKGMEYTFSGEINNFQVLSLSWYNEMPRQEKEGTSLFPVPGMIQMRSDESQE
jgi:hypothetical protein